MTRFRALHTGPQPLLLPNAWDVGSALAHSLIARYLADNGSYHPGRARADALAEWDDPQTGDSSRDETFQYILLKQAR